MVKRKQKKKAKVIIKNEIKINSGCKIALEDGKFIVYQWAFIVLSGKAKYAWEKVAEFKYGADMIRHLVRNDC